MLKLLLLFTFRLTAISANGLIIWYKYEYSDKSEFSIYSYAHDVLSLFTIEVLCLQNDFLIKHLYETDWYNSSMEFRSDMVLFMAMLQKPLQVKLYGNSIINLGLLSSCIKTAYSVVQIIYKSQNT